MAEAVTAFWRALRWERPEGAGRTCVVRGTGWAQPMAEALPAMAAAEGEISFKIDADQILVTRLAALPAVQFETEGVAIRPEASYVVTGGWGALGLVVADWLVEAGARKLVLNGRNAPDELAGRRIAQWRESGVEVVTYAGDLGEAGAAQGLVAAAAALGPVRGVVHAAGVLRDGLLLSQGDDDFAAVWQAKAASAERLLTALGETELDFCVLYSSIASAFGSAAQSNYAAANGYLDGLAAAHRAAGRPVVSVRWGPWAEEGMSARLATASRERLATWGFGEISPATGRSLLGRLFASSLDPVVLPLDRAAFQAALGTPVPGLFRAILTQPNASGAVATMAAASKFTTLAGEARLAAVTTLVSDTIARLLGLKQATDVAVDKGLFDLGVDSLSAVDLKNRLQSALGLKIPATLVFDYPTVEAIAGFLNERLAPAEPGETAAASVPRAASAPVIDEDDLEALLARELGE